MIKKLFLSLALASSALAAPALAQKAPATAPDPAKVKLAGDLAMKLLPPGSYQKMMSDLANGDMMQQIMGMDAGTLAAMAGEGAEEKSKVTGKSLLELAGEADPHFKERMDITMKVMFEEMGGLMTKVEPDARAALAKIYARKYDEKQLSDMNVFFAGPSGSAFARDFMASFTDKEMMDASMKMIPALMEGMPAIIKKVEAATAHLPPQSGMAKDAAQDAADAAADAAGAAGDENGTEPWYDRENWTAADRSKIETLEAASDKASGAALDFELAAMDRSRQRYLKQGWKPEAKSE